MMTVGKVLALIKIFTGKISSSIGNLSQLTTTAKTDIVSAINEVDSHVSLDIGFSIVDGKVCVTYEK